ncbi:helix-turn-helix domain-containing protein [Candidatus Woesearchaeota archaeon]|nr:helix-turn-helix domain-containing protein [Candidatus Woesearchaeota archaeon]
MEKLVLKELGLSKNESKVYLALLKLGSDTILEISKKSNVHRANVYDVLGKLIEKGLASYVVKGGKRCYQATEPEKLLDILREHKEEIEKKEKMVSEILPKLAAIRPLFGKKSQVTILDGVEGIKNIFEQKIKDGAVNYVIGAYSEPYILESYLQRWHRRRVKAKIMDKMLFKHGEKERAIELNKLPYTECRSLPQQAFASPVAINIWGEKVALVIGLEEEPLAILIENKAIAKDFFEYFNLLWKMSKPV